MFVLFDLEQEDREGREEKPPVHPDLPVRRFEHASLNMSEKAFCTAVGQLTEAVHDAFLTPRKLPAFLLLFTSLDIVASLTRPVTAEDTSGQVFMDWVTAYMLLPDSGLSCTAMDVWGARCGFLHTLTTESSKSRQGAARELQFIGDDKLAAELQQKFDPELAKHIFVPLRPFVAAFINSVERFATAVQADANLQETVYHHASRLVLHETV